LKTTQWLSLIITSWNPATDKSAGFSFFVIY